MRMAGKEEEEEEEEDLFEIPLRQRVGGEGRADKRNVSTGRKKERGGGADAGSGYPHSFYFLVVHDLPYLGLLFTLLTHLFIFSLLSYPRERKVLTQGKAPSHVWRKGLLLSPSPFFETVKSPPFILMQGGARRRKREASERKRERAGGGLFHTPVETHTRRRRRRGRNETL